MAIVNKTEITLVNYSLNLIAFLAGLLIVNAIFLNYLKATSGLLHLSIIQWLVPIFGYTSLLLLSLSAKKISWVTFILLNVGVLILCSINPFKILTVYGHIFIFFTYIQMILKIIVSISCIAAFLMHKDDGTPIRPFA